MKAIKRKKPYWEMTPDELAKVTAEFNQPIPLSKTRPLSAKQRATFDKMKRSPHRSVYITRGADGVFVRINPDLLRRTVRYAADHQMTLSEVVNRSLKGMLAFVE